MGGGGGGKAVQQDPQVGEAARINAQTAKEQLDFTKQYFNTVLTPLQQKADQRADVALAQQTQEYEDNRRRALLQDQRYQQYGIPAEDRYYRMVADYSAPAEEERQANLAQADVVNAQQAQLQNLARQFAAAGIDPTSPAAISAATNASVMGAAIQASAANQARAAARQLGIALTSDAANFGRGTTSNIAAFSQLASGNSMNANAAGQQPLANGLGVGSFVQGGYRNANAAYGQNLSSLVSDSNTRLGVGTQRDAANAAGIGQAVGAGIGAAGLVAAAALLSDRRVKENVHKVGKLANGLPVYVYNYKGDDTPHIGLIAQDVEKRHPEAVVTLPSGVKAVRYDLAVKPVGEEERRA